MSDIIEIVEADNSVAPRKLLPPQTELGGRESRDTHEASAAQNILPEAIPSLKSGIEPPWAAELTEAISPVETIRQAPRSTTKRVRPQPQATCALPPVTAPPAAEIQGAFVDAIPYKQTLPEPEYPEAWSCSSASKCLPPDTELGGQGLRGNQAIIAAQPQTDEGLNVNANLRNGALVGEINVVKRRYDDLRRARQRLELQAMATCRSYLGGDKEAGAKLYRSPTPEIEAWLVPYMEAMKPLDIAIAEQEKLLTKLGKQLPVIEWANAIAGLSPRFLAMVIGECGIGPGEYRTVSALWKRMGLAVINGERQRRVTGEAALEHGYVARRRSLMWNIGESIIKQQVRKAEVETRIGIGELGQLYLDRKVHELTKTDKPIIAHNRAKRYMEKRLLRELWRAWRRAIPGSQTDIDTLVSEQFSGQAV